MSDILYQNYLDTNCLSMSTGYLVMLELMELCFMLRTELSNQEMTFMTGQVHRFLWTVAVYYT